MSGGMEGSCPVLEHDRQKESVSSKASKMIYFYLFRPDTQLSNLCEGQRSVTQPDI